MARENPLYVLVVEDDVDVAASVCEVLEQRGHIVDVAYDGVSGLHLATVNDFDVLVLDLGLPGIDGLTLCRQLRDLAPGEHDFKHEDQEFEILISDHGSFRYAVVFDETSLDRLEDDLTVGLVAVVILGSSIALLLGPWAAGRITAPVSRLAAAVRASGDDSVRLTFTEEWQAAEVADLARAFEQHTQRIAIFIVRERAFTDEASHELRNPVMSATAAVDVLLAREDVDHSTRTEPPTRFRQTLIAGQTRLAGRGCTHCRDWCWKQPGVWRCQRRRR